MWRVRLLGGKYKNEIKEFPYIVAQSLLASGLGELPDKAEQKNPEKAGAEEKSPPKRRRGRPRKVR